MKKIIITAVLLSLSITIDTQVRKLSERGHYLAGSFEAGLAADIGLSTTKKTSPEETPYFYYTEDNNREFYLNLKASLGYYLLDFGFVFGYWGDNYRS